jgi:glutamyl-tRNA synthetase
MLGADDFVERTRPFLSRGEDTLAVLRPVATLVQERVRLLTEVEPMVAFLLAGPLEIDEESWAREVDKHKAPGQVLDAADEAFASMATWDATGIEAAMGSVAVGLGFVKDDGAPQLGKVQGPVRVATTGRRVGPPLWESLEALGRERTLERLRDARSRLR